MTEKRCTRCKTTKPIDAFHRLKKNEEPRHSWCKECHAAYRRAKYVRKHPVRSPEERKEHRRAWTREYNKKNKQRRIGWQKAWRDANKEKIREERKLRYQQETEPQRAAKALFEMMERLAGVIPGETKRCNKCKEIHPLSAFNNRATAKDGKRGSCRECDQAQYYETRATRLPQMRKYIKNKKRPKLIQIDPPTLEELNEYQSMSHMRDS